MSQALGLTRASFPSTAQHNGITHPPSGAFLGSRKRTTRRNASDKEQNEKHIFHQNGKHWKGTLANSNLRLPGGVWGADPHL